MAIPYIFTNNPIISLHASAPGELQSSVYITPDGTNAVIGFIASESINPQSTIRVYSYNAGNLTQRGTDITSTPSAPMGYKVMLSDNGNRLFTTSLSTPPSGLDCYVYIFDWNGTDWVPFQSVFVDNHNASSSLLWSKCFRCSADGTKFMVSASNFNGGTGFGNGGNVYFFESVSNNPFTLNVNRDVNSFMVNRYIVDIDPTFTYFIGATSRSGGSPAAILQWDGIQWLTRGTQITPPVRRWDSVGISGDGNVIALMDPGNGGLSTVRVYSWNGSDWTARPAITPGGAFTFPVAILPMSNDGSYISSSWQNADNTTGAWHWNGTTWDKVIDPFLTIQPLYSDNPTIDGYNPIIFPTMHADKTMIVPYNTYNFSAPNPEDVFTSYIGIFDVDYVPSGPTAVDDTGIIFNIHTGPDQQLTSVSVFDNDTYSPPPTGSSLTSNMNADFDDAGHVVITTAHPLGSFTAQYTITDSTSNESNSANIEYIVVDMGYHTADALPTIPTVFVNDTTVIVTASYIISVLERIIPDPSDIPNLVISFSLTSGRPYTATAGRIYTVGDLYSNSGTWGDYSITPDSPGPEEVIVNFSFNGWDYNVQQSFEVLQSLVFANGDFVIFNVHATNQTTLTSDPLTANDTYYSPQVQNSGTINTDPNEVLALIDPDTKIMSIPSNFPLGSLSFTYTITDDLSKVSNQATVDVNVIDFGPHVSDEIPELGDIPLGTPTVLVDQDLLQQTINTITSGIPSLFNGLTVKIWHQRQGNSARLSEQVIPATDIAIADPEQYDYIVSFSVNGKWSVHISYEFDNMMYQFNYAISRSFTSGGGDTEDGGAVSLGGSTVVPVVVNPVADNGADQAAGLNVDTIARIVMVTIGVLFILFLLGLI